jgi:hypothetical protein
MIGQVTYLSDEPMRLKFGRRLKDKTDFAVSFAPVGARRLFDPQCAPHQNGESVFKQWQALMRP